ncbi:hypothetical protein DFJ77DRAFT_545945 [Powellomyces hirtus]|nr:hypothetical protein DFJ77DRAFT_545945 [Powellomyces hirtus]
MTDAITGPTSPSLLRLLASLSGFSAVALGAFGAHALAPRLSHLPVAESTKLLSNWRTAATYHLIHSLALLYVSDRAEMRPGGKTDLAGYLFAVGNVLFSGSIYALVLDQRRSLPRKVLGPATPVGGLCYLAGWIALYWC